MKAVIEDIPFENRGIEVTSESEEERQHLETMWSRGAAAVMLARNDNGSVALTIAPPGQEGADLRDRKERSKGER